MLRFDNYTLRSLEYDKIKDEVSRRCYSDGGRRFVERMAPYSDALIVEDLLTETVEMKELLLFDEPFPLEQTDKIDTLLDKLKIEGSMLEPLELKRLAGFQGVVKALYQYRKNRDENFPRITRYLKQLDPLDDLSLRIERAIDPAGEVKDSASDRLRRIRLDKINARARIMTKLNHIIGDKPHRADHQDDIITIRDGRFVIPVVDSDFSPSSGVVHDRSRSGTTLFIEPTQIIELNNKLKQLQIDERHEVERILLELSDFARSKLDQLQSNWGLYSRLDFIYARGRFAVDIDAIMPQLKSEPVINLKRAYHPLLLLASSDRLQVVPNDIEVGFDFNVLVITGPNTGGKTVAVKGVGLLVLLTQSGLLIPVDETSELGIFARVHADIGDEQSIELSLSTFSSHIERITRALENCNEQSLLLFDEIGAGTDPQEGAALGEAIIEYVAESNARCIVTTHYSALKTIAEEYKIVENASFEFDRKTLKPTYRLRTGLPGSSYALEIASRLGMPKEVIGRAGELVGTQERSLADLISKMEKQLAESEDESRKLEARLKAAEELEHFWQSRSEHVERREKELLRDGYSEATGLVEETKRTLDLLIKDIRENSASKDVIKKARKTIDDLRRELANKSAASAPSRSNTEIPVKGDRVWVDRFQTEGDLIEVFAGGKKGKVQIKNVLYTMEIDQLAKVDAVKTETLPEGVNYQPFDDEGLTEVSLIGMTVDEAREELDRYFDKVELSNLPSVRIVHGKGTGALRRMVREYLSKQRLVASFELGQWNEGGSGVTVAKLKSN